jgi:hypothetical protein
MSLTYILDNATSRFTFAHTFLTQKLIENDGVLTKCDIKKLQKVVNRYVAFGEPGTKYEYGSEDTNGVFFAYNMSQDEYINKSVGDSTILFHTLLSFDYGIDITSKSSNTLNKIISKNLSDSEVVGLCNNIKNNLIPFHLDNVGKIPSEPKIVVGDSGSVVIMLVFFRNNSKSKKMRVLVMGASASI